jgi:hypothetical protein
VFNFTALWAGPLRGQVLKRYSCLYTLVWPAFFRVVNIAAPRAFVFFHLLSLSMKNILMPLQDTTCFYGHGFMHFGKENWVCQ